MCRRWCAYVLLLLLPAADWLYAQDVAHTAEPLPQAPDSLTTVNSASIMFDRNLNTYTWIGRAAFDTLLGATRLTLAEQFSANIIQIDAAPGARRRMESDQQVLSLRLAHAMTSSLSALGLWSSLLYTDNKGIGLGNASMNSVLGGLEYSPVSSVTFSPLAGYRWDHQSDVRDRGPAYSFLARAQDIDLDGYRIAGAAQYHEDRLDPRRLESHFARAGIQKTFSPLTRDSLEIGFVRNRREFYALADSTIESRGENIFAVSNLLEYGIDRNFNTAAFITVTSRGLEKSIRPFGSMLAQLPFTTRIDELHLDAYVQARYLADDGMTGAFLRVGYSERDETHAVDPLAGASVRAMSDRSEQERSKDNLTRRTSIQGLLSFPLSASDRVTVSGATSIVRYDTPSELNHDDRDELLAALTIATSHTISRYLEVGVSLDGTLSHLVYLLGDRSANNNYNRIIRLAPRVTCRPTESLVSMNAFEVLANYTVYDFEQQLPSVRSFAYRQFGWIDSSSIAVTHRIALDFFTYLKFYERGQLKWSEFTERTENSFADKTLAAQARFTTGASMMFAVGIRYFSQTRYAYDGGSKRVETFLRSVGPTCAISWDPGPHSRLSLRGWYESRRQPDGTRQGYASMTMNILFNF